MKKDQVFKAFGDLLYAVASADGKVQVEEKELLASVLSHHHYAFDIISTFKSHSHLNTSIEKASTQALETFIAYGYFEGYAEFKIILEHLAEACEGISAEERKVIDHFFDALNEHFNI